MVLHLVQNCPLDAKIPTPIIIVEEKIVFQQKNKTPPMKKKLTHIE